MIEKKESNDLDSLMDKASKQDLRKLQRPRSLYKLQRMLTKEFCVDCRDLAFRDSKRPFKDYCVSCQAIAGKVLGGILK